MYVDEEDIPYEEKYKDWLVDYVVHEKGLANKFNFAGFFIHKVSEGYLWADGKVRGNCNPKTKGGYFETYDEAKGTLDSYLVSQKQNTVGLAEKGEWDGFPAEMLRAVKEGDALAHSTFEGFRRGEIIDCVGVGRSGKSSLGGPG